MKKNLTLSVTLLTALFTLFAAGTVWKLADVCMQKSENQIIESVEQRNSLLQALSTTEVCSPWMATTIGTAGTATSTFDECAPDTLSITTNAAMSANATADNQRVIYQTLCGNGAISVKLDAITASSGFAGLFVRETLSAGSRKVALMSQKGASVFRQLRATSNQFQVQATFAAPSHNYLKLIRTGNNVVGQWSTNGTTWNTAFNTPLAVANGCVEIGLFTYSNATSNTVTGAFSDLTYEPPAPPATTVSFADSILTAAPGDTVQVCVNTTSICECTTEMITVDLLGDSLPHFANFTGEELILQGVSNQQCFDLVVGTSEESAVYQLISIGNNSIDTLQIEVNGGGSDVQYCGPITRMSKSDESIYPAEYFDDFGNSYSLQDISLPQTSGCGCEEFLLEIPALANSIFNLTFGDCIRGLSIGFNHPSLGVYYRKTLCRVLSDLSSELEVQATCIEASSFVNIYVVGSDSTDLLVGSDVLGAASTLYEPWQASHGGIIDGMVWKAINGGLSPELYNRYHANMVFNFDYNFYAGQTLNLPSDQYDLYTIALHEVIHTLGFTALMESGSGAPKLGSTAGYSRYATFLHLGSNTRVVEAASGNPYIWALHNDIVVPGSLHSSCRDSEGILGPDMFFKTQENVIYPIFTGAPGDGSAFSHLSQTCTSPISSYVMNPSIGTGLTKTISDAEWTILCSLGYKRASNSSCGCSVAGANGYGENACEYLSYSFEYCLGVTGQERLLINPADLLGNDVNAQSLGYLSPLTPFDGEVTPSSINPGWYEYAPGHYGLNQLKYIPFSSSCNSDGSIALVDIRVRPCAADCIFLDEENSPPNTDLIVNPPCNLLCNSSFALSDPTVATFSAFGCVGGYELPGWLPAVGTPDYSGGAGNLYNDGTGHVSMKLGNPENPLVNTFEESIYTPVTFLPGRYILSTHYVIGTTDVVDGPFGVAYNVSLVGEEPIGQFNGCFAQSYPRNTTELFQMVPDGFESVMTLSEESINRNSDDISDLFKRTVSCIDIGQEDEFKGLWFWGKVESTEGAMGSGPFIYLDQVELIPDNFSAGTDVAITCGQSIELGGIDFCMPANIRIKYTWLDEQGIEIGSYNVYHRNDGSLDVVGGGSINDEIPSFIVAPLNTTTYRLERSILSNMDPNGILSSIPFSTQVELCDLVDDVTIIVNPVAEEDASFTTDYTICELDVSLTGTSSNQVHHWDFGDGNSGSGQLVSHTYAQSGVYLITHTVGEGCEEASYSEEVIITFEETPAPSFSYTANCGEVSFSIAGGLPPGATIVYGGGSPTTGSSLTHTYAQGGTYTATLQIPYVCGTAEIPLTVVTPNCLDCEECIVANTIGSPGTTTLISTIGALPSGAQRCIEGTLVINQTTVFTNAQFRMGAGAAIVVEPGVALTINNSSLEGCGVLWRGIVVENGATLAINGGNNSLLADAVLGVHLLSGPLASSFSVRGGRFERNFVAVYKGKGVSPLNLLFVWVNVSGGTSDLAPAYAGADQLIEGAFLPPNNGKAWAGVWLQDVSQTLMFSNNQFLGLSVGLHVRNSSFTASQNRFINIVNNHSIPSSPVTLQYLNNIKGCAVYGVGVSAQHLNVFRNFEFSNCQTGIRLEGGGLMTASSNTMNGVTDGILLKNVNVGGANISFNNIQNARKGIQVLHGEPGSELSVSDNTITLNPVGSSDSDLGILLDMVTPSMPGILAAAEVFNNPITLDKGRGIMLENCQGVKVRDNTEINLMTTAARAGIWVEGGQRCEITDNKVTGAGITLPPGGTANTANIGINIVDSPGNAYCCNTIEDTHVGIRVAGASASEDRFRGNTFEASSKSLYLPDNVAIIGTQEHTQNCWKSGSGQAEYGVGTEAAQEYPIIIDNSETICFKPNLHSPAGWFDEEIDIENSSACLTQVCNTTNFKPDSPDTKRIAAGAAEMANYPEALLWGLQRHIFEHLKSNATQDSLVLSFMAQSDSNTIGAFQQIHEDWAAAFAVDSTDQKQVASWLAAASVMTDSASAQEALLLQVDSSSATGLLLARAQYLLEADSLGVLADTLASEITTRRMAALIGLRAENGGIGTALDYITNEKEVNDAHLAYYAKYESNPDSTDLIGLNAIANQCPLLGGHAVYRARALLTVLTGQQVDYQDSLTCAQGQAFYAPYPSGQASQVLSDRVLIYPNPAHDQVHLSWSVPIAQTGTLRVTDLLGRPVLRAIIDRGQTHHVLPVSNLPSGLYWFQIELDGSRSLQQVVINR